MGRLNKVRYLCGFQRSALLTILLISLPSRAAAVRDAEGWEKLNDENGIAVFRRELPNNPVVMFKGTGIIDAPLEKVALIILDQKRLKFTVQTDLRLERFVC